MPEYAFPVQGYRGKAQLHHGRSVGASDLFAPAGTSVLAMAGGTVVDVGSSGPGGHNLTIRGDDGLTYYYAHLREAPPVRAGQRVDAGARIGSVGDTGNAKGTGAHLHIGIGRGIQSGVGPEGGAGRDHDAVAHLNEALAGPRYQTVADQGGEMDRPPSTHEPPSRFAPPPTASSGRSSRMQARIAELQQRRAELRAKVDRLLQPGPDETPAADEWGDVTPADKARADAARANRVAALGDARSELTSAETALRQAETDVANDPDPKAATQDPVAAERARVELQQATLELQQAQNKAAAASSPEAKRLANLEIKKAELAIAQAELNLEQDRNPRPPQRAPRYPDEIAQSEASAAASRASANRTNALLPGEIAKGQQSLEAGAVELEAARKALMPKQQQILQSHLDTVKYVQGMLERGEIEPGQADAYVAMSKQAAEAGLRGTTPFDEMKEKRSAEQARQRMGTDLLNQRLSSGQGLASSLLSAASSLASNAMMKPGQTTLGVDPLANLMPLLAQLQGGEDVTPFARGLLMGAPGGGAPAGPLPAGL